MGGVLPDTINPLVERAKRWVTSETGWMVKAFWSDPMRPRRILRRMRRFGSASHTRVVRLIEKNELRLLDRRELERRSRGAVQPVYLGDGVALCRVLARYKCFVDASDVGFGAQLLLDGFWESWLTRFMIARVQRGDFVIDVGANHGYYTLIMADMVGRMGRVACVEPNPALTRLLRRNLDINGFADRVTLLEQAATAVDDQYLAFCAPAHESKNGALLPLDLADLAAYAGAVPVRGGRLATALAQWERLDFVKVDVEGAEEAAVDGLFPLLERFRPKMVLEFNLARCIEPRAFLDRLARLYGPLRAIGFDGRARLVEIAVLMDADRREDWLLYLSGD